MKIIVTGSLGHISQPLTLELVQKGHHVTVISNNPEKQKDIEGLGATAAIGSLEDAGFLTATFSGADAAYCMIPPNYAAPDIFAYYRNIGSNYAQAIEQSGIKRAVHLSSFGTDLDKGTGIILGSHYVEGILNDLPDAAITHVRPTSFYYNLFGFVKIIKEAGFIAANYGGEDKMLWVSPTDIAAAAAEEIVTPLAGRKVRYVASDELTCNETASILGEAIGKPDLKWATISDEEMQAALEANGTPAPLAANLVELYASLHSGVLAQDYHRNKTAVTGKVKMTDFAKEFATVLIGNN